MERIEITGDDGKKTTVTRKRTHPIFNAFWIFVGLVLVIGGLIEHPLAFLPILGAIGLLVFFGLLAKKHDNTKPQV